MSDLQLCKKWEVDNVATGLRVPVAPTFTDERAAKRWQDALPYLWFEYYSSFRAVKGDGGCGVVDGESCGVNPEDVRSVDGYGRQGSCRFGGDRLSLFARIIGEPDGVSANMEVISEHGSGDGEGCSCGVCESCKDSKKNQSGVLEGCSFGVRADVGVGGGTGDGLVDSGSVRLEGPKRLVGPNGGLSKGRGPNYEKNQQRRVARKSAKCGVGEKFSLGVDAGRSDWRQSEVKESVDSELKRSFDERRIAENKLATQRAKYNIRRNDYLQKARVSEQRWETERLSSDEKLRKITEARLGASPGFAKTIVEEGLASPSAPSLSDGTVSPNSSISVEEVQKMNRTIEKQAAAVVDLQKKLDKFVEMFGDEGETVDDIIYPEQRKRDSTPQEPTHKVMWGECVPLKGRYKFQADHYQNGNLVIAIDGEIVEVDWRGEPFEYCGRDVLYVTPSMDGHIDE